MCKAADEGSDPSPQEENSTEEQDVQDVQDPVSALPGWGTGFPWCPKENGDVFTPGVSLLPVCCSCNSWFGVQELEAIKAKLREIEKEDERLKELQLEAENHLFMSSEAGMGCPSPGTPLRHRVTIVASIWLCLSGHLGLHT